MGGKDQLSVGAPLAWHGARARQVHPTLPPPPKWVALSTGDPTGGPHGPHPFPGAVLSQQSLPWTPGSVAGGVPFREQTALKEETPGVGTVQPEREAVRAGGAPLPHLSRDLFWG